MNGNENKKQSKKGKKKDKRLDLSAENFPTLGGKQPKQQQGHNISKNNGYAQALLKKTPTEGKKSPSETEVVTAAMSTMSTSDTTHKNW